MVIEQFALFIAQCCLNNWFKVLSTGATLEQSLVSQLIGTNKQSIKMLIRLFLFITIGKGIKAQVEISLKSNKTNTLYTIHSCFQVNCQNFDKFTYVYTSHKMARSSHSKGSVSVDLFNLPTLLDERRVATSYLDIPVDFYLPDGKKLQG